MLFLTWMHPAHATQKTPLSLPHLSLTPWRDQHPLTSVLNTFFRNLTVFIAVKWFAFVLHLLLDHKLHLGYFEHHMFWTSATTEWIYTKGGWMKVLALKGSKLGSISVEEIVVVNSFDSKYLLSVSYMPDLMWCPPYIKEQNKKISVLFLVMRYRQRIIYECRQLIHF